VRGKGKGGRGGKEREEREREGGRGVRLPLSKFLDPPLHRKRIFGAFRAQRRRLVAENLIYSVSQKTSPTFLAVTLESIVRFS